LTVDEFNINLGKFEKNMIPEVWKAFISPKIGFDVASTVRERVINKQVSGNETNFGAYSTRPMLTSGTTIKSKNVWRQKASSKTARRKLKWVTLKKGGKNIHLFELPGGYAELRRLEGFSNRNKSFWFRGSSASMWANFGLIENKKTPVMARFVFGGKTQEAQDLINYNSAREGKSIIAITENEKNKLVTHIDNLVGKELKKAGI